MRKNKNNKLISSDIIKNKIPYGRCFEEEGIIETCKDEFSKCYYIQDINPQNAKEYSMSGFDRKFKRLLNELPDDISFQFVIHNKLVNQDFFLNKVIKEPEEYPEYSDYLSAYNDVITDNADVGHNNVKKDNYFVISMKADLPEHAVKRFRDIDEMIKELFMDAYGIEIIGMSLKVRLKSMYSMLNPGRNSFGNKTGADSLESFSFKTMKKYGLTTKDVIAPSSIDNKDSHKDYMVLNNDTYVRSLFINLLPDVVSNSIISDITSISSNMLLSIHYDRIPKEFGLEVISADVANNMTRRIVNKRESLADRKLKRTEEQTQMINYSELDYFNNAALNVFKQGVASETEIFACSIVITLYADDLETLNRDTQLLYISTNKFAVQVKCLDLLQLEGFQSSLPLCNCKVDVKRVYNLDRLAVMQPLNVQEVLKKDGLFFGLNAINDNLIIYNRKNFANPAGLIAGVEHCGKTFQNKREIFNALISTNDRICVVASGNDYDLFIKKLGGIIIENPKTNMFEAVKHYGLLESRSYSKSLMLEALFKACMNDLKLGGIEMIKDDETEDKHIEDDVKRIISLCEHRRLDFDDGFQIIEYIKAHPEEFKAVNAVTEQLEAYFGRSRQSEARIELYKANDAGSLICILNHLWNRSIRDKADNMSSWLFIDPIDPILESEQGLDYLTEYVSKCNDFETVITMVVRSSVKLISDSKTMIRLEELVSGCGYFKLLNQGAIERRKYSDWLNIPNSLINYITNVDYGKGLIITPSSNIAFDDNFTDGNDRFYSLFKI